MEERDGILKAVWNDGLDEMLEWVSGRESSKQWNANVKTLLNRSSKHNIKKLVGLLKT